MPPHADGDAEARLFAGVRFALHGFNTLSESQVRAPPPSPPAAPRSDPVPIPLMRFPSFAVSLRDRTVRRRPRRGLGRGLHPRHSFRHLICEFSSTSTCDCLVPSVASLVTFDSLHMCQQKKCRMTQYAWRRGRTRRRLSPSIGWRTASNLESWLMQIGSVSLLCLHSMPNYSACVS